MAWAATGYPYSGSAFLTAAIVNAIVADIRTWGGNVDGGGYALTNCLAVYGPTGANPLKLYTNGSERARITSGGLVGLNTTSPTGQLTIAAIADQHANDGIGTVQVGEYGDASYRMLLGMDSSGHNGYIQCNHYGSSWQPLVLNPSGGNVGIGGALAAPLTTVHVAGSSSAPASELGSLLIAGGGAQYRVVIGYDSALDHGWIQSVHNGVSSTPLLVNPNGGNVGIGTVAPTSALQVVGLPSYASNALALAGGLTAGAFYRNGDNVCVAH